MSHTNPGTLALLAILFAAPLAAQEPPTPAPTPPPTDARTELKDRMKVRYPVLQKLRDAGKIGESRDGEVKVVKPGNAKELVDPQSPPLTVGDLIAAENKDRQSLYDILAKELKLTAAEVARQNGLRNLDKASPLHWIEVDRQWVQRQSIKIIDPNTK